MRNAAYIIFGIIIFIGTIHFYSREGRQEAVVARAGVEVSEINQAEKLNKIKWVMGGMKRTWWYVQYENGVMVYSHPEHFRTVVEVATYYLGGGGDWEAFYFNEKGKKQDLCYQHVECAALYIHSWGAITDMGYENEDGQWVSVSPAA